MPLWPSLTDSCREVIIVSVGPDDLLALAKELSERSDEVARRAAISRAYYAGFHAAVSVFGPPSVASSR